MNAIIVARVSTEEQKEAGNSLPAQLARLEKYCKNKGFPIIRTFSFEESAYKDERDEFDRILDFVLQSKEKVALCFDKVDRFSRNSFDTRTNALYRKVKAGAIELHFVSDNQIIHGNLSANEKFQFKMNLDLAEYYSNAISDNVRRAQEQKLRKGEWLSKAPFGYKNITKPGDVTDIIVDEHNKHILIKVFELYATGAFSMDLLCQKLKKEFNINWPKGFLGKVLQNPFYHGVMIVKKTAYPHRYPPLISKTLFDQVQQIKKRFNKQPYKYAGKPYVYRGLLRCGHCGLAITPEKHKGLVYYHCTEYNGKHGAKWLREEEITDQLGQLFKSLEVPQHILQQITEGLSKLHQDKIEFHNKHFDAMTKEHKALTRMMDNLYLDKLKGRISDEQYDRLYADFRDQLADINVRLARLQEAEDNYYINANYVLQLASRAYELFKSSEVEEKRQLLKLVLSNLRIEGEKVLWNVQKPFDVIANCSDRIEWRD